MAIQGYSTVPSRNPHVKSGPPKKRKPKKKKKGILNRRMGGILGGKGAS